MNLRSILKGALLVTVSAALIAFITIAGFLAFIWYNSSGGENWGVSVSQVSSSLARDDGGYAFTGTDLLPDGNWALLLDQSGQVIWSFQKPADVPDHYTLTEVASFTRWYLEDYPVQCWVREDGLLVVGSPKGSIWKHNIAMDTPTLLRTPFWFGGIFLLALVCVLALAYCLARRWFRQAQQVRDSARSDWINGVSHDIRTPLSVVMGYAAQLEDAPDLPPGCRRRAAIIRTQSQTIRDLVNDLNLTMRLDCAMQALRRQPVQLEPFLRQVAADPERRPLPVTAGGQQPADQLCSAQRRRLCHYFGSQNSGKLHSSLGGRRHCGKAFFYRVQTIPGTGWRGGPWYRSAAGSPNCCGPRRPGEISWRNAFPV